MGIDYNAIAEAGGISKGESRFDQRTRRRIEVEADERRVHKLVDQRDANHCRVCGRYCDPRAMTLLEHAHRHHLVYRSAGGATTTNNLCTLCAKCHAAEHAGKIQLSGDADQRDPVTHRLNGIKVEQPTDGGFEVIAWV